MHAVDVIVNVKSPKSNPVITAARIPPAVRSISTRTSEKRTVPKMPAKNAIREVHKQNPDSFLPIKGAATSARPRKPRATPNKIQRTN